MRLTQRWPQWTAALVLAVMSGGCVLVPEIEDRVVELVVGGSTTLEFPATGSVNTIDETATVNFLDGFNLAQILYDNEIDVTDVHEIALSGIDYRIKVADSDPARKIATGAVTIARGGSGALPLISNFDAPAGAVTDWQPAPLDAAGTGVAEINAMLHDILDALKLGTSPPASVTTITYHVTGQSLPSGTPTTFTWELKIKVGITGTVKVKIPT